MPGLLRVSHAPDNVRLSQPGQGDVGFTPMPSYPIPHIWHSIITGDTALLGGPVSLLQIRLGRSRRSPRQRRRSWLVAIRRGVVGAGQGVHVRGVDLGGGHGQVQFYGVGVGDEEVEAVVDGECAGYLWADSFDEHVASALFRFERVFNVYAIAVGYAVTFRNGRVLDSAGASGGYCSLPGGADRGSKDGSDVVSHNLSSQTGSNSSRLAPPVADTFDNVVSNFQFTLSVNRSDVNNVFQVTNMQSYGKLLGGEVLVMD